MTRGQQHPTAKQFPTQDPAKPAETCLCRLVTNTKPHILGDETRFSSSSCPILVVRPTVSTTARLRSSNSFSSPFDDPPEIQQSHHSLLKLLHSLPATGLFFLLPPLAVALISPTSRLKDSDMMMMMMMMMIAVRN
jgi:hypothetical protein